MNYIWIIYPGANGLVNLGHAEFFDSEEKADERIAEIKHSFETFGTKYELLITKERKELK